MYKQSPDPLPLGMKSAILFGASGLVGSNLLTQLLDNPAYDKVMIVVRKPLPVQHPKLTMIIGDYASLPDLKQQLRADEVFISLGTTKKKTPDQNEYYRIDHDYPVLAASIAKDNGARSVLLVSAIDANASSKIFYVRTKGQVEADIIALGFEHTYIFRPSLLVGDRKESRPAERLFIGLFSILNPLFAGSWRRYHSIQVKDLATAIINAASDPGVKVKRYHWQDLQL
jgi:uncharacterized protein YbjT (DUF2867 family)